MFVLDDIVPPPSSDSGGIFLFLHELFMIMLGCHCIQAHCPSLGYCANIVEGIIGEMNVVYAVHLLVNIFSFLVLNRA